MKKILSVICAVAVLVSTLALTVVAEDKSYIFFECVESNDHEIIVDLCIKDSAELGIKSFGFYLEFSSNLVLASQEFDTSLGTPTFYDIMGLPTDEPFILPGMPCQISWTSVNDSVGNAKLAIARLTFISSSSLASADADVMMSIDLDNIPKDASGNLLDNHISFIGLNIVDGVIPESPVPDAVPGDSNNDGNISLVDAALMLQHIAEWEVNINLDNADVNDDGEVNLTDVSLLMKYIAGWDVVLV